MPNCSCPLFHERSKRCRSTKPLAVSWPQGDGISYSALDSLRMFNGPLRKSPPRRPLRAAATEHCTSGRRSERRLAGRQFRGLGVSRQLDCPTSGWLSGSHAHEREVAYLRIWIWAPRPVAAVGLRAIRKFCRLDQPSRKRWTEIAARCKHTRESTSVPPTSAAARTASVVDRRPQSKCS
jgi:hypothetical protein